MWIEIVLTTLLLIFIWDSIKKPSHYPPGAWGLPILGYLPLTRKKFDEKLEELKKNYEKIFCWRVGEKLLVFINDFEYLKASFKSPDLAYRPRVEYIGFVIGEYDQGITLSHGLYWQTLRRFTLRHMRDLGMGKSRLVSSVHYEAAELVNSMKKSAGQSKPLSSDLRVAVVNVIWQLVASKRFEFDEKSILQYDDALAKFTATFKNALLIDVYPWMKSILPKRVLNYLTKRNNHENLETAIEVHLKASIDEHIENLDVKNARDFIDEFLIETEKENSNSGPKLSVKDLTVSLADIFGAAYQTTAMSITWGIYYMAKFPDVQKQLQKEIDEILPNGIQVTLEDKLRLPYTEAFISEIFRYSSLFRFILPRSVIRDTKIGGYIVPKGSVIFGNAEGLHFDIKYFDSPKEFRPQRFLNDSGRFDPPKEGFIPFGIGKRLCIGESLARMELLIFLVTLVQHLEFSVPEGEFLDIAANVNVPITNLPKLDQKILITLRTAI